MMDRLPSSCLAQVVRHSSVPLVTADSDAGTLIYELQERRATAIGPTRPENLPVPQPRFPATSSAR